MTEPTPPGRPGAPLAAVAAALARERRRAGWSIAELARRAGIAKSTLSQLESHAGNPSVETLWALSTALGIPLSRLVEPPQAPVRVVRAGDGPQVPSEHADYAATLLAACPPHARRDLYLVTAEPGAAKHSDPHAPGVVEHVVVVAGRAGVGPVEATVEVGPGDYACYPGDVPHVFDPLLPGTVAAMVTEHP